MGFYNDSTWTYASNATVPAVNNWTHYAGTWNGSHMILYVNGVAVNITRYTNRRMPTVGIQQFWVGRRYDTGGTIDFFPGLIDNVVISNRTYSPEQILALAQNQTHILDAAETNPGDNWTACVTPNDGWNQGVAACTEGLYVAGGVLMRSVSITPTAPITNDTMLGWCNGTSGLSDNVAYYWQWFNNSIMVASGYMDNSSSNYSIDLLVNIANVSAANTTKDDAWVFSCMAAYGGVNSTWVNASVTINNTAPVLSAVTINSTFGTNTPDENLSLQTTTHDDDNDFVRRAIDWRVDGNSIYSINMNFDINNSNGTGSTKSHSSWGNNGSITGATWTRTGGVNGTGAYDFDASGDYIRIPHDRSIKPGFGNLTFFAWIYPESPNDGVRVGNDRGTAAAGTQKGWQLKINDINSTHWMIYDSGIDSAAGAFKGCSIDYCDGGNWTLNEWHHIGFVYVADDKIRWYVDGVNFLNSTVGAYGNISPDLPLAIGAAISSNGVEGTVQQLFNGRIDEVVLSLDALSEEEVSLLYTNRTDTLLAEETSTDQAWTACVTPNDGVVQNTTVCSSELIITNGVETEGASITPTTAYTVDTILGWCNGTNTLNTNISYYWQWYKNSTLNTTGYADNSGANYTQNILVNLANISASNTTSGDVWVFSCFATYGIYNGTWSNSSSQAISNTAPSISSLAVSSDSGTNTTTEDLTATASISDDDGNTIHTVYDWKINGTSSLVLSMDFFKNNSAGTGVTRDYAGYGNNGTNTGNAVWRATGGINGSGAYEFDGSGDYLLVADQAELDLTDAVTLMAWVYPEAASGVNDEQGIMGKREGDSGNYHISIGTYAAADSKFGFNFNTNGGGAGWNIHYTSSDVALNTWTHVAATYNETHIVLYVNGVYNTSREETDPLQANNQPFYIGSVENSYFYFDGFIDDARVYNRALTGDQVYEIYAQNDHIITASETEIGQNWSVCVTSDDGVDFSSVTCTTGLLIIEGASDSCTPPSINSNWLVYAADNCTKSMTSIDLGAGNLTVSGEQGSGHLRFNTTNLTASNVNILGYGNLSRIIIENGGRVSTP